MPHSWEASDRPKASHSRQRGSKQVLQQMTQGKWIKTSADAAIKSNQEELLYPGQKCDSTGIYFIHRHTRHTCFCAKMASMLKDQH